MSCHNCTRSFSLFHREYACPNCGFGHCSGCLKHKAVLPKTGKECGVCSKCHTKLTSTQPVAPPSPPKALQKRLERLEPSGTPRGLAPEDHKIALRLERLHQERNGEKSLPSEEEVRQRLQKLKGAPPPSVSNPSYQAPDPRTATERAKDLMSAVTAEVKLDSRIVSPEEDIAARLAKLKGEAEPKTGVSKVPNPSDYLGGGEATVQEGEEDLDQVTRLLVKAQREAEREAKDAMEELKKDKAIQEQLARLRVKPVASGNEEVKEGNDGEDIDEEDAVIKQILAEQKLEERIGLDEVAPPSSTTEPEELPWCVICNEDAKLRCQGCGGDLYCPNCYREFHEDEDPKEHITTKFAK